MRRKLFLLVSILICIFIASVSYAKTGIRKDKGGDRLVVTSAGTLLLETGATFTAADGSIAAGDIALADTKLLIGGATGVGAEKSMSGDATIANTGALTIATGAVEDSMIEALAAGEIIVGVDGTAANNAIVTMSGDATMTGAGVVTAGTSMVKSIRLRPEIGDVNTGTTLLAAVAGLSYRVISINMIAVGGALGTATSIEIEGDQSGAIDLFSVAAGGLTQSTVNTEDGANTTVVADGASFVANSANTAITMSATGTGDTATHISIVLTYTLE